MTDNELDIQKYAHLLIKWWWLIALTVLVAVGAAWYMRRDRPIEYQARTQILVQQNQLSGGAPSLESGQGRDAWIYVEIFKTATSLERIVQEEAIPYTGDELGSKLRFAIRGNFIDLVVIDSDPQNAANIANLLAKAFIENFQSQQLDFIAARQAALAQRGIAPDPSIVAAQIAALSTLQVVDRARPPSAPSARTSKRDLILPILVGLVVGAVLSFFLESLDKTIKSPEHLKALTGVTTLASVERFPKRRVTDSTAMADPLRDGPPEVYRFLSTNLEFAASSLETPLRTLLVTSARPGEGKTTSSVQLAAALARDGKRVIVVDADLRRPSIHRMLRLERSKGLTALLANPEDLDQLIMKTGMEGLQVVLSGSLPPDPTLLLKSRAMRTVLGRLRELADFVIVDSPPVLAAPDAIVLAALVDAAVLVIDPRTGHGPIRAAVASLRQTNVALLGAVLNKIDTRQPGSEYYYYQRHYYRYSTNGAGSSERSPSRGMMGTKVMRAIKALGRRGAGE